jgi:uncharacterized protein (DUF983 family)
MYNCPICGTPNINFFRKWLSYPALPAFCKACKSYSHAQRTSGGVGLVVAVLVITVFGFAAAALQSGWPLLVGIAIALAYYIWRVDSIHLEPLSPELVSKARKAETMTWFTVLMAFLFNS